MTDAEAPQPPTWKPLAPNQRRVLGVLIEKAKTTPAAYPLTVNAIVTGSNQKNNREPLMALTDADVEDALRDLQALGAVSEIDWMGRANKYKHQGYEWLGVDRTEMAVMAELLLRGEQTLGDLRGRAARMEPIADLAALKPVVDALIQRGLMIELTPAGRGQVVSHNLYSVPELAELRSRSPGSAAPGQAHHAAHHSAPSAAVAAPAPHGAEAAQSAGAAVQLAELAAAVVALRAEVAGLREQVADLARRVDA